MSNFNNKTYLITGASRGIGKAIAMKLAGEGARIVIAAKSTEENNRLGGTICSVAGEIESLGGEALPVYCDIRDEELIRSMMDSVAQRFGGLDGVVNNASAISLTDTENTSAKKFDLMFDINVRGTFLVTRYALPLLKLSSRAHILTLSPPPDLQQKWFVPHLAYTLSKYNMSLMAKSWSLEFKKYGIASNTLWPATLIATAAIRNLPGGETLLQMSRKPEIMAEAASVILQKDPSAVSGRHFTDEEILRQEGISDFSSYAITPGGPLQPDLFL